jgi:hypothetical protein
MAAGCGQPKKSSARSVKQIFVKGDPLTMIANTTKEKNSFITHANYMDFRDYAVSSIQIFAEKEVLSNEQIEDIETGNEAEETDQTQVAPELFTIKYAGPNRYELINDASTISLGLVKDTKTGKLNLNNIRFAAVTYSTEIEHYSVSKDQTKISFLFRLKDRTNGSVLMSAVFYKYNPAKAVIAKTDARYKYINGPGVLVPWKLTSGKKIKVNVCPSALGFVSSSEVREAFEKWEEPFKTRPVKLDIEVVTASTCKPFSDVNESSLHYVSEYLTIPEEEYLNPGFALMNSDLSAGHIFDADIVLLGSEIQKSPSYRFNGGLSRTLIHEFGHFLGLDHQFDGYYSVMSYENVKELGTYDMTAMTELYKEQLK